MLRLVRLPNGTSGEGRGGAPGRFRLALIAGGFLALAVLAGCAAQSRGKLLSIFFDGADSQRPPTRRVRRDLLREIRELKRELAKAQDAAKAAREALKGRGPALREKVPAEKAKTWADAVELLPKDRVGGVDWVKALQDRAIAPRPGIEPDAPDQAVLELDVELASSPGKLYSAIFSHDSHTRWLTCKSCHPAIFPLRGKAGPTVVTMAEISAGESCGVCHGSVAFGVEEGCARCHSTSTIPARAEWRASEEPRNQVERVKTWPEAAKLLPNDAAGGVDWVKALQEKAVAPRPGIDPKAEEQMVLPTQGEMVPAGGPAFKAVFSHKAHTEWLGCPSCHSGLFEMAKAANPTTMAKISAGESCGVCHGSVAFGVEEGCARCHSTSTIPARAEWRASEEPRNQVERVKTWPEAAKLLPNDAAGGVDWVKALQEKAVAPRPGIDPKAEEQMVLPNEEEMVPAGSPAFKAVFSHKAHTEWLGCPSCHSGLFEMAKAANPTTMAEISAGESCGACHGSVAFGVEEGCARCHPALSGK